MRLYFYGADQCVTGSCHCLEVNGKRILVDCGLQQGRDEIDNAELPFHPGEIDAVLVTHAHIDHSGRIPLLIKQGFRGRIFTTRLTGELMDIMLQDSGHIQESDAEWQARKAKRSGAPVPEALYTVEDAVRVQEYITPCEYGETVEVIPGVRARFEDAGHLLGSAYVFVEAEEAGEKRCLVFSGDIGNVDQPIIRDPAIVGGADFVVMESTYGDRNHDEVHSYTEDLARVIDETLGRGGNVVIPAFAVGRTQELLYFIREIKAEGLVRSVPDFPVYIDSPLAQRATRIFAGDLRNYLDEDAADLVKDGIEMFRFPGLRMAETSEESKALNTDGVAKVIISASGMCDAGRIRHHLKHNLWRPESTVVFVGYQAEGTLGRRLLDGVDSVKLFGEEIAVRARTVNFDGLSSHADRDHLLAWIQAVTEPRPRHVFVVHGDREVSRYFAETLRNLGLDAHAPQYTACYDLLAECETEVGYLPERKRRTEDGSRSSSAYERLLSLGQMVLEFIKRSRGRDNKTLSRFADQLRKLLDKWEDM